MRAIVTTNLHDVPYLLKVWLAFSSISSTLAFRRSKIDVVALRLSLSFVREQLDRSLLTVHTYSVAGLQGVD
jgi:hypothetical protein